MSGELRSPRPLFEQEISRHASRGFAGGMQGSSRIPRPIQNLDQNRRQVPKDPPPAEGLRWVYDPDGDLDPSGTEYLWDFQDTQTIASGASYALYADSSVTAPSWGYYDGGFLYISQPGLYDVRHTVSCTNGGVKVRLYDAYSSVVTEVGPADSSRQQWQASTTRPMHNSAPGAGDYGSFVGGITVVNLSGSSESFSFRTSVWPIAFAG